MNFIYNSEGINGILPNLDLVNVVVYLCHTEHINIAFHDSVSGEDGWRGRGRGEEGGLFSMFYLVGVAFSFLAVRC